ncbi:hypothetical protein A8C56_01975 [Niabella ginsenosidivorans]|uniref:Carbohydrate-binding protein SusD n=1 Tax=Niabella ginsenosidivorans TaxID=1176587 RepID=A0A1A9HXW1_9BACT|nr:RagB/SusD family nutrient uptake outer membrane protein [Niabella ginsenosidivorans]ANH79905.1 hypothetical protein A8C56_01975 [Niabella ginsenosidivorans]
MRKVFYIIAMSFCLLIQFSCKKILDVAPEQSIEAGNAIENDQDVEALIIGGYSIMGRGSLYGTNLLMIPDLLASEDYCSWRGTFVSYDDISLKQMTPDNADVTRTWTDAYAAINNANIVLENIDKVQDEELKKTLQGEAYFIRGIMHFELVRLYALPWGATPGNSQMGVVIKTTPTTTEDQAFLKTPRSSVAEVYKQVIEDLQAAIQVLPDDNGTRADKFTAYAFLSRVYMQQQDYVKARDAASEVIKSGKYKMNASISAVFANKNTDESIWEIQQNEQNNAGDANDGMATFYASLDGIGRADVRIDAGFIDTYPAGDYRSTGWYYEGTGRRPGNMYCSKWLSPYQNLPVVRIAEMYLNRAECNQRLGTTVGATPQQDLAQIRNEIRVGLDPVVNPGLQAILDERFHELAFEGTRIHDLRRLHLATGDFDWNANELVFPIPQRDVDASEKIIKQNPGY